MEPAGLVRGQMAAMVKRSEKKSPIRQVPDNKRPLKGRMDEVYAKAAILFRKKRYINASVNEIAKELGIQKGSLYYYIDDKETLLSKRNQYEEIFLNIIRDGISRKVFRKEDEKILAYMILGSCNWLYQWFSPVGEKSPRQIADIFSRIFLNGLLLGK